MSSAEESDGDEEGDGYKNVLIIALVLIFLSCAICSVVCAIMSYFHNRRRAMMHQQRRVSQDPGDSAFPPPHPSAFTPPPNPATMVGMPRVNGDAFATGQAVPYEKFRVQRTGGTLHKAELLFSAPVKPETETEGNEFEPGAQVRIHGLQSAQELNGQVGKVLSFDFSKQRYVLELPDGSQKSVKRENLEVSGGNEACRCPSKDPSIEAVDESIACCEICCDNTATIVLLPCGHGDLCRTCTMEIWKRTGGFCHVCRQPIQRILELEAPLAVGVVDGSISVNALRIAPDVPSSQWKPPGDRGAQDVEHQGG